MKNLFLFVLIAIVMSSCQTFEDTNDFPSEPSKLVVNCLFNPDSTWYFEVGRSLSVLDNAELSYIDNATIKIYENGNLLETITTSTTVVDVWGESLVYYSSNLKPSVGNNYSIVVSANGYEDASAEASMPSSVPIEIKQFIIIDTTLGQWDAITEVRSLKASLKVKINDPSGENNFYELRIFSPDTEVYDSINAWSYNYTKTDLYISSGDPSVENANESYSTAVFFTDELFNGQSYELGVNIDNQYAYLPFTASNHLYGLLISHSRDSYLYFKSVNAYQRANGDFFAEPVQVYGNINGGYGIFGGYDAQKATITY